MFLTYLPADILIRRVNFVGGNPMAAGHYRVEKRADNGFIYVLGGSAHYDTDSSSFDVTADDVFCLAKGARYEFDVAEGYRVLFVNFDLAEGEGVFGSGIAMRDARSRCRDDFRRLKIQYARKDATMLLSCRITLYNIIQALVSEQQKKYAPSSRYQPVQRAIAHMERHYADPTLSMAAVADAAGVSEGHLRRLFRQLYRLPPNRYLQNLRIGHAQDLLVSTSLPLGTVAEKTGFSSLYYFSDAFHRSIGVPPSVYRRMNRVGMQNG